MRQSIPAELRQSIRELVRSPTLMRVTGYALLVSVYALIPAWFNHRMRLRA